MSSRTTAAALVALATFTDIVAYSIAVPVLPALSRQLGASSTMIGLLFASFGVTLVTVSIPMGAVSDRMGRKGPIAAGMALLAGATVVFALATTLPSLFLARLVQGAADAITWVVGFALLADLYDADERGRVTGFVMMGTSAAFMIGPTVGGWLYDAGGVRLPFFAVAALAACVAAAFGLVDIPDQRARGERVPVGLVLRVPEIALCALAVVAIASTISMFEPVLSLHLNALGVNPGRIGVVYGAAAIVTTMAHPVCGRLADRFGSRRVTAIGFLLTAAMMPVTSRAWSFPSAVVLFMVQTGAAAFVITPSLAYMAEATTNAGVRSFGVSYGLYNLAWGAGLLGGPALGGFLFDRLGFGWLLIAWTPPLAVMGLVLLGRAGRAERADAAVVRSGLLSL